MAEYLFWMNYPFKTALQNWICFLVIVTNYIVFNVLKRPISGLSDAFF